MKIETRDGSTAVNIPEDDLNVITINAKRYNVLSKAFKENIETCKAKAVAMLDKHNLKSIKDVDGLSIVWSEPSKQSRLSRDKILEVFVNHGIPVDAIEDCYTTYDRKAVVTIKQR